MRYSPNGLFAVIKPPGMSSHDVVNMARRVTGQKKVGHAGTLDPGAAGLLVLGLGGYTKLAELLQSGTKWYRAELVLGVSTDTGDTEGEVIARSGVPFPTREELDAALLEFSGPLMQEPPMFSAVKRGGVPLYKLARRGEEVQREPRPILVESLSAESYHVGAGEARALLDIRCSPGTYVRVLCVDIASRLGAAGHMGFLVRHESGAMAVDRALTIEEFTSLAMSGKLDEAAIDPRQALPGLPVYKVSGKAAERVPYGNPPVRGEYTLVREGSDGPDGQHIREDAPVGAASGDRKAQDLGLLYSDEGRLLALVTQRREGLRLRRVLVSYDAV